MTKAKIKSPIVATFVTHHLKTQGVPDPAFPQGRDVDFSRGAEFTCVKELPCPAPEFGYWVVHCQACNVLAKITAMGRIDDPRSLRMACIGREQ